MTDYIYENITVDIQDGIAWTALNRPEKKNAISDELGWAVVSAEADAARNESLCQIAHFLDAEHRRARQEGHILGHAITATQVAAIGDRQAQIADPAAKAIGECVGAG